MDDRSWMYPHKINGYLRPEFVVGVDEFLNFAFSVNSCVSENMIKCPCRICKNRPYRERDEVQLHLYRKGFVSGCLKWPHRLSKVVRRNNINDRRS